MASAGEVFENVSAALGSRIKRLPGGETRERSDWITWLEPVFSEHPAFQKSGEFFRVHATGTGRERYTLKPGIKPQDVRFDNLFYADRLRLPPETELCLGLVHFTDGIEGTKRRMETAKRHASRFAIATECGFGRRDPATIAELLRIHAAVADAA